MVCDLLGEGHRRILLNLADVDYVDSTGLGHLVSAVASVRKMKGDLRLLKLTNRVHDVLQITRLHTIIDIMGDEAVAIESSSHNSNSMTVDLAWNNSKHLPTFTIPD